MPTPSRPTTSRKGILRPQTVARHMELRRHEPGPEVGRFVERYWTVRWDLRGHSPQRVELLPHPCVNVTFEGEDALVHGVGTQRFGYLLEDAGAVFGVKFRPGGFHAFAGVPLASLTDRSLPLRAIFGAAGDSLATSLRDLPDDRGRMALFEAFLRARLPEEPDDRLDLVQRVITLLDDRSITRVEHVSGRFGVSTRTLERLFQRYVGVSPKRVIRRHRLQDCAERLAAGPAPDLATIALDLGYFDQAHFARDFKALVGLAPAEYAAACASDAGEGRPTLASI